jgi:RHS repeat-associated protein
MMDVEATLPALTGDNGQPVVTTYTDTYAVFDSVGNQTQTNTSVATWQTTSYQTASAGQSWLRNFYDGADQLKLSERHAYFTHSSMIYIRTTQEDYFYDALGRRVALRTRRDSSCTEFDGSPWVDQCTQSMDRFIWDGADLVTELRDYGGWDTTPTTINGNGSGGRVQYTQASGVLGQDVPLLITRSGAGFVPWPTWHGTFEDGTNTDSTDMTGYSWPARTNGLYFTPDERITAILPNGWWGSLIDGKQSATGLMYDRNRYYSPESGQFTQGDPIGLAGGLNSYGYAGGDPVNSADPFGLCPPCSASDMQAIAADVAAKTQALRQLEPAMLAVANLPLVGAGEAAPIVISAASKVAGAVEKAPSFFEGASYTPKVLQQMQGGVGEFHSFPESVTAFESAGTVRTVTGGDNVVRQVLEIPGSYGSGEKGVFQFIKDSDGTINHRLFVPKSP